MFSSTLDAVLVSISLAGFPHPKNPPASRQAEWHVDGAWGHGAGETQVQSERTAVTGPRDPQAHLWVLANPDRQHQAWAFTDLEACVPTLPLGNRDPGQVRLPSGLCIE